MAPDARLSHKTVHHHINLIISFALLSAGYVGAGLGLKKIFKIDFAGLTEKFFLGGAAISVITLLGALLWPQYFGLISFILIILSLAVGIIILIRERHAYTARLTARTIWPYLLLFIMVLPLFVGNANVRLWGDEMNFEGPAVRNWLANNNFSINPNAWFGSFDYPRLWVIMIYQILLPFGTMHEAAGRWLTIFIVFCGSLFVWKMFQNKLNFKKWPSLILAGFWMSLVFVPMFAWSASWYYEIMISMLVMLSFYYIIAAKNEGGKTDLKFVAVSAVFMALITGIRPEGFLYIPLLLLLLFVEPLRRLGTSLKLKALAALIVLMPSMLVFFSWRAYVAINHLPLSAITTGISGRLEQLANELWPTLLGMFQVIRSEWSMTGFWLFCLFLCFGFAILLYKKLNLVEKQLLLLLTVPIYKFVMMFFLNITVLSTVRMGRHIMQTAPLVYFVLGFLIIKFINLKFGDKIEQMSANIKRTIGSILLIIIFLIQLSIGSIYSRLPSEMNAYVERWVSYIQKNYPELKRVQLIIPKNSPPTTRIHLTWRYYSNAFPSIYSPLPSSVEQAFNTKITSQQTFIDKLKAVGTDAVLLYAPDDEFTNITNLGLANDKDYLLKVDENNFEILHFENRPYLNTWGVPFRNRAIKSFVSDLKFWQ